MRRVAIFTLASFLVAFLSSCSKEDESCSTKCREAYEECLERAGDDADAKFDCGEQRTDCLNTCMAGATLSLIAPEESAHRAIAKDAAAGCDGCPCAKAKKGEKARQSR